MKYDIWIRPHLPTLEEREPDCYYWPRSYVNDVRLSFLDKELYINVVAFEQQGKKYDMNTLIGALRGHPDKEDQLAQEYLTKLGKTEDELTKKEHRKMLRIKAPLTPEDIESSLKHLEQCGYIKRLEE